MTWNWITASRWQRLLVALLIVAVASAIRVVFFGSLGKGIPYLLYFPTVTLAALYGGLLAGCLATTLSAALVFFWIQQGSMSPVELMALAVFFISSMMISFICEMMRRTPKRAKLAQEKAEAANQELRSEVATRKQAEETVRFQNEEKGKRADELAIANKELAFQSEEKGKRADELVIANKELAFQNEEKGKRADELAIANKELAFQNEEKGKRADELAIANKELAFQSEEKGKRAGELEQRVVERTADLEAANRALQASSTYARSLIETGLDPLVTISAEGKITDVNEGSIKVTGMSREKLIGTDFSDYFTEPDKAREGYQMVFAKGFVTDYPLIIRHKDGRLTDVLYNASVYKDAAGNVLGVFAAARDVTERKRAEEETRQLNAQLEATNKELETFSYSVSHDLRAPLRHVQGYVDMLGREAGDKLSDKGRRYMKTITDASQDMGALIDDLLAFSRMSRAEMCEVSVNLDTLVQATLRDLEPDTRSRNIVWKIPSLPAVQADAAMLKLALANLLGNAVKFTRPRNPAVIEIGVMEDGSNGVMGTTQDAAAVSSQNSNTPTLQHSNVFFVRDNGVGFDPQYVQKLFGIFQRLHQAEDFEGTGIGLANVRRIIARHGGRTWAEGKLGEGATFYFTLRVK